jgi:hypothetical protein
VPSTLVFPDGVRLATRDEIPGTEAVRSEQWARLQSASITPGFVLKASGDARFSHYAEINVDAPQVWALFCELATSLLASDAALLFAHIDAEPAPLGSAPTAAIIAALEPHCDQLAHDGYLQFGLVSQQDGKLAEVFVAPTKYFKVWLNDATRFRAIMARYGLPEAERLMFLDEYARTTVALQAHRLAFSDVDELAADLRARIAATPSGE